MNMAQTTQEKRSIKVKDFLQDFHADMGDEALMQKYQLSPVGLEKFYSMLLERGILASEDFDGRYKLELARGREEPFTTDQSQFVRESDSAAQKKGAGAGQTKPSRPIELPLDAPRENFFADEPTSHTGDQSPGRNHFSDIQSGFDDSQDEIVSGMPLDYAGDVRGSDPEAISKCGNCSDDLYPGVRKIYDGKRSVMAAVVSVVCLLAGFAGGASLMFFEGYSLARLVVIYFTGVSILLGTVLVAVSLFMLLFARERVYACLSCGRVYPRI